jgi:hypothetical protein
MISPQIATKLRIVFKRSESFTPANEIAKRISKSAIAVGTIGTGIMADKYPANPIETAAAAITSVISIVHWVKNAISRFPYARPRYTYSDAALG